MTIVVCSTHFGVEVGKELGWCTEAETCFGGGWLGVHGHCSKDLATQDRQADHIHGLGVAVGQPVDVDTLYQVAKKEAAVECCMGGLYGRMCWLLTVQEVGSTVAVSGDGILGVAHVAERGWSGVPLKGRCCKHWRSYRPGN